MAVEFDLSLVGPDKAGDHVENRGFAGAVGPEQADRLATPNREADILDDHAPPVAFPEPIHSQNAVPLGMRVQGTAFSAEPFAVFVRVRPIAQEVIAHRLSRMERGSGALPAKGI